MSEQQESNSNGKSRSSEGRVDESTLDEQTRKSLAFVRTLVGKMQMNVEVNVAPNDGEGSPDEIRIEIEGPDAGRIIGKKGNVLDAIQYLTARVVVRPGDARRHVIVDAEGYRARHEDQLAQMARRLAERVATEAPGAAGTSQPPEVLGLVATAGAAGTLRVMLRTSHAFRPSVERALRAAVAGALADEGMLGDPAAGTTS